MPPSANPRSHDLNSRSQAAAEIELAPLIDHTLLAPAATTDHILKLCDEAERYGFASVCVYPVHVPTAVERLYDKKVKVCTVIGFPSGATTAKVKLYEAQEAVENGVGELDVVINLGWLKMGEANRVHQEIATIVELCDRPIKAILETTILTPAEKQLAAEICLDAGVDFLKTSTGWQGGATVEDVKLLRQIGGDRIGIKASGGIRTVEDAIALVQAGANRLGTSRGVDIIKLQAEAVS
ncbi:deoxyribose-phosphate aldolase [cf. Phormidesmis sp. LEGE 11477]|uniref:deoxyribose-phosphate aldolase n=1 Tax=cf. Phormidesmis sp. LEGE 11477 TaxID=1828680 RepID=UPI00188137A0|nr:deoxyribose-phosphate aldolase [cf. Phormidesmis sp. LEGE 11477]MBE9062915.1 deoxyribose-phosphate aldolase [cf. Phormidesmis sp. LEGE 11477]